MGSIYNKDNKLQVFTAFSGYDSQCLGLERLKEYAPDFDYNLVGWSEINKWSCVAHDALFPQFAGRNYGDISKIDWSLVPDFDLFTYSSPCFIAGTEVIVKKSLYKECPDRLPIEDVNVGDFVLTHTGEYKKVLDCMKTPYIGILYTLHNSWGDEVTCTPDHKFYCSLEGTKPTEYEWVAAKDIELGYHHPVTAVRDKWDGEYYLNDYPDFSKIEITLTEREIYVYNLEVEDNNSYTANDFVVHNCQDWSSAGWQRGGLEGSGTRSSLLWECRKTIEIKRPKYCLLENVLGLLQDKFFPYFQKWIDLVNSFGYKSYYHIMNAKDYGVPQNRPRVFLVSVRNDVDLPVYSFPNPLGESARPELYEILEPEEDVDPKFIRSEWRKKHYMELNEEAIKKLNVPANAIPGKYDMKPMGLYCHCSDPFNQPPLYNLARTLKTESIESGVLYKKDGEWHERLFTYRELFRLMGLKDSEFDVLQKNVTSVTHLQRMAGNSIVVNVLFHIFRKMFIDTDIEPGQAAPLF